MSYDATHKTVVKVECDWCGGRDGKDGCGALPFWNWFTGRGWTKHICQKCALIPVKRTEFEEFVKANGGSLRW